ncbi:MAG: 1,4-dihydroxy-6-naphthoate synthase [Desulfobacterales bacterium]|nr:1,4-dihydroxy-6-naphthoate synthase [Desulfobacterales bacterium]
MSPLTLGFSPCPNDTFIFHALINDLTDSKYTYDYNLHDVEKLNKMAIEGYYDITKLSFAALGNLTEKYGLLKTGAALGKGCGPLLVKRKDKKEINFENAIVAIPGEMTTANLLLNLYSEKKVKTKPMRFDQIFQSLVDCKADLGVIIHEGRFTYQDYNLEIVQDLGEWWEKKTSLPIPLGGIAAKREISDEILVDIEKSIGKSIKFAYKNRDVSKNFIKENAQELSGSVIEDHIKLYVNEYSLNLEETGIKAITKMFEMAKSIGFFPNYSNNLLAL